jgi:hypothetical protein
MTISTDEPIKALVYIQQKWVNKTGSEQIFRSANVNPERQILVIPVTRFDISDHSFVEIVFWPRVLADQPVKSVKAFIPKQEVALILELKSPDALPVLGYRTP